MGKKNRYVYAAHFVEKGGEVPVEYFYSPMAAKLDIESGEIRTLRHVSQDGHQMWGGELVFVPRPGRSENDDSEDDGFLITMAHDERTHQSQCLIIDARTMLLTARLAMPQRVPYGFHAFWCPGNA